MKTKQIKKPDNSRLVLNPLLPLRIELPVLLHQSTFQQTDPIQKFFSLGRPRELLVPILVVVLTAAFEEVDSLLQLVVIKLLLVQPASVSFSLTALLKLN